VTCTYLSGCKHLSVCSSFSKSLMARTQKHAKELVTFKVWVATISSRSKHVLRNVITHNLSVYSDIDSPSSLHFSLLILLKYVFKKCIVISTVAQAFNSSYSGGGDWEKNDSRSTRTKSSQDPNLN
jgi:hypothetical protein